MTAKTTLVQLHHKVETFEGLGKHLVLVLQDVLMDYMRSEFNFSHIQDAKLGHALHFHSYTLNKRGGTDYRLNLKARASTDTSGMAQALGLQVSASVELEIILAQLENKLSDRTLLTL